MALTQYKNVSSSFLHSTSASMLTYTHILYSRALLFKTKKKNDAKIQKRFELCFYSFLAENKKKKWEKAFIFAQQFVKVETLPVAKKRIYKTVSVLKKRMFLYSIFCFYLQQYYLQ